MANNADLAAQLAQVQRQRQQLQNFMHLEPQEAELTVALQAVIILAGSCYLQASALSKQPVPHAAPDAFAPLSPPPAPSVFQTPPAQPMLVQYGKPNAGGSIAAPIAIDDTPPPTPRREVKQEEAEPLALLDELNAYAQHESTPDTTLDDEVAPRGA
ncbi:hypothetical protein DOTSEDRAFT_24323 [Dothistroma septosporum NZE10]|uniref:Uncharacterized protein n=1 Tax=Dothistroma septosporum (strain NZE10 / CBS 128990) TaxID=675120 RepID=N1PL80_DOTSN|nr:hypothetical protein DOTSEDRAFT_24323 [Dothistroma septosporum NZE10]